MTENPSKKPRKSRTEKIAILKAELQRLEGLERKEFRKERNGQLIALGIFLESYIKAQDSTYGESLISEARNFVSGRNLDRITAAVKRINGERKIESGDALISENYKKNYDIQKTDAAITITKTEIQDNTDEYVGVDMAVSDDDVG